MNGKELVRAQVRGEPTGRLAFMPITMSFAAKGIGAKYRAYATDYRVLAEGQLAFAERFGADHVSAISDPAVEAADLGQKTLWYDDEPPANDESSSLLEDKAVLARLRPVDPGSGPRMSNRLRAVSELAARAGKDLLVEGWVEGPCAEGADLRGLSRLMMDFYDDPEFVRDLLAFTTEQGVAFASAQIRAGADVIGVGDAASSLMGPDIFSQFIHDFHRAYIDAIHAGGALARLHICGNTTELMPLLKDLPYDIIDLDTQASLPKARAALGPDRLLLGHIDTVSVVRGGTPETVRSALREALAASGGKNYIVSAGCEVPGDSPAENLEAMRDFARAAGG